MHFCLQKTNDAMLTVRANVGENDQVIREREGKMIMYKRGQTTSIMKKRLRCLV